MGSTFSEEVNIVEYRPYEAARLGHRALQSCYIHTDGRTDGRNCSILYPAAAGDNNFRAIYLCVILKCVGYKSVLPTEPTDFGIVFRTFTFFRFHFYVRQLC